MKRMLIWALCVWMLALLFSGCNSKEAMEAPLDVVATPSALPGAAAGGDSPAPAQGYGSHASVSVSATAAYVFDGAEGTKLYGAAEFKNDGDCPVRVDKAEFTFSVNGETIKSEFTPVLADFGAVLPGETSYVTVWLPAPDLHPGDAATLTAALTAAQCGGSRVDLCVDQLYLADNYPGFGTLSGRIACLDGSCSLNIIHVGFYDQDGKFLCAWYFTKNALFEAGDVKNFVVHMRDLPIEGLAERVATMRAFAFGFDA